MFLGNYLIFQPETGNVSQETYFCCMKVWLAVFIGGGTGSLFRFALQKGLEGYSQRFPWGTLAANVLSCLVMGWTLSKADHPVWGQNLYKHLLITGFCGGFSTFSSLIRENWQLGISGSAPSAIGYDAASFALGLGGLLSGLWLGNKSLFPS